MERRGNAQRHLSLTAVRDARNRLIEVWHNLETLKKLLIMTAWSSSTDSAVPIPALRKRVIAKPRFQTPESWKRGLG
jgi:hypothetical protein